MNKLDFNLRFCRVLVGTIIHIIIFYEFFIMVFYMILYLRSIINLLLNMSYTIKIKNMIYFAHVMMYVIVLQNLNLGLHL
jgi:hypothetical protein